MEKKDLVINRVVLDMHTYGYLRKNTQDIVRNERKGDGSFKDIFKQSMDNYKKEGE